MLEAHVPSEGKAKMMGQVRLSNHSVNYSQRPCESFQICIESGGHRQDKTDGDIHSGREKEGER